MHVNLIGRFGNCMFQYAWARAYAEQNGCALTASPWVGDEIFDLEYSPPSDNPEILPTAYHQCQASLIYTRKQAKEWFRLKPGLRDRLESWNQPQYNDIVAHRRIGDYERLGYVVVSKQSYYEAFNRYGYNHVMFVTEEHPGRGDPGMPECLPDFYRLMVSRVLSRANSTFSWWAATLGNGKVYSPVIEGLEGGKEQDCEFVEGNWPRFANLDLVTDLNLEEG